MVAAHEGRKDVVIMALSNTFKKLINTDLFYLFRANIN